MESAGIEELLAESVGIKESLGISKVIPNHVDHIPKWRTPRSCWHAISHAMFFSGVTRFGSLYADNWFVTLVNFKVILAFDLHCIKVQGVGASRRDEAPAKQLALSLLSTGNIPTCELI